MDNKRAIEMGETALGIEFGSTRIKASLINKNHEPIAGGDFTWENRFEHGVWTYHTEEIHEGLQTCYKRLVADIESKYGVVPTRFGAIGISAMMHGYLPFDADWNQLTEFRTWRNTITGEAAEELTKVFDFNIPQRWSIAHLYQAVLNKEAHLSKLAHFTTLAGYIHHCLTGVNALGVGEASGMFPIDSSINDYDATMLDAFDRKLDEKGYSFRIRDVLPKVLVAGADAGCLTEEGARFLDPSGKLEAGIPFAPAEGDAGTGMVATNSVRVRTGNVSAGTSDFAMIVVDKKLGVHRELDMVTTPAGRPVAMVHCNNCTSDINAWVDLLAEFGGLIGADIDKGELYPKLFNLAMTGDKDCGGLLSFNYFSGEGVTDLDAGRPLFIRTPDAKFTLANFMRTHIMSAMATLKIGLDILTKEEQVPIDAIYGHGGFFKTPEVGQRVLSAAVDAPISVMETAGEGGPYGMALLAAFTIWRDDKEALEDYLGSKVFGNATSVTVSADADEVAGFASFLESYKKALDVERAAITSIGGN
ncbi:MAG: FGGY-family carbohydrate kinase [Lachnospiraceae bacterium]|nr:FGGY-family carbohydrate kinase [Lachnospiraceae bacterium]